MSADTTPGLAPCPFFGSAAHFEIDDERWEWVECESCGMQGNRSASLMEDCKPKLAEAWNRRAPAPAQGPTDAELAHMFAEETGFDMAQQDAAVLDFARAVLARWGAHAASGEPVARKPQKEEP